MGQNYNSTQLFYASGSTCTEPGQIGQKYNLNELSDGIGSIYSKLGQNPIEPRYFMESGQHFPKLGEI